jgi:hypothetical protein
LLQTCDIFLSTIRKVNVYEHKLICASIKIKVKSGSLSQYLIK